MNGIFIKILFIPFSMSMEKYDQIFKKTERDFKIIVGVTLITIIGLTSWGMKQDGIRREYAQTYSQALLNYADTNHNGLFSTAEVDEFHRKLLKGKGVILIPDNPPKYRDGAPVPVEVLTEWIKNYRPSD